MFENSHKKDLEEIFLHVKKLKAESGSTGETKKEKSDNSDISRNNNEKNSKEIIPENISPEDIFEIVEDDETVTKMDLKTLSICDLCGQDISFDENLSGLVLFNRFFACEECCKDASNEVLNSWIETRNAKAEDVKPIALWLMQEKQKTRLI